jgi:hypothetical protein
MLRGFGIVIVCLVYDFVEESELIGWFVRQTRSSGNHCWIDWREDAGSNTRRSKASQRVVLNIFYTPRLKLRAMEPTSNVTIPQDRMLVSDQVGSAYDHFSLLCFFHILLARF